MKNYDIIINDKKYGRKIIANLFADSEEEAADIFGNLMEYCIKNDIALYPSELEYIEYYDDEKETINDYITLISTIELLKPKKSKNYMKFAFEIIEVK